MVTNQIQLPRLPDLVAQFQARYHHDVLVIFYGEPFGRIIPLDIHSLYKELRRVSWNRVSPSSNLDIIIHTTGGHPDSAYRMTQTIRDAARDVSIFVPEHAYSAGVLFCFGANRIYLADNAGLSPVDITWEWEETEDEDSDSGPEIPSFQLLSFEYFRDYAIDCRLELEKKLRSAGLTNCVSDVEAQLLVEMTKEVQAVNVGQFYRERTITEEYARTLLAGYMLNGKHNAKNIINEVVQGFIYRAASHELHMDFHLLEKFQLPISEASLEDSDTLKSIIEVLQEATDNEVICMLTDEEYREPFFQAFPMP
jgi:hypothetical protein